MHLGHEPTRIKTHPPVTNRAASLLMLCVVFGATSCAVNVKNRVSQFELPEPSFHRAVETSTPFKVEPTFYYTPSFRNRSSGYLLLDMDDGPNIVDGQAIRLSQAEWCTAALEGSVSIVGRDGRTVTLNYAGLGEARIDCVPVLGPRFSATSRVRFAATTYRWGDGTSDCALIPYRTIAVDPERIPLGALVYVPAVRGVEFQLDNKRYQHDGFFIAADTGGVIKGNKIDIFTGPEIDWDFGQAVYRYGKKLTAYMSKDDRIRASLLNNSACNL
jgi:3D (Asp-Asp-Asp) domain-containing protein